MLPRTQIELVVFDLVGTTIYDGEAVNRTLRATLAASGLSANREAVNGVMGLSKIKAISTLLAGMEFAQSVPLLAEKIHTQFNEEICSRYQTDEFTQEMVSVQWV